MTSPRKKWVLLLVVVAVGLAAAAVAVRRKRARTQDQVFSESEYRRNLQDSSIFRRSYYLPGTGTLDTVSGFPSDPITLEGPPLPCPIVVVNNIGGYLIRIGVDGMVDWARRSERVGHGTGLLPGRLYYSSRNEVVAIDPYTGRELSRHSLEGGKIAFVNCSEGHLIVGFGEEGPNRIQIYAPPEASQPLKRLYSCPQSTHAARHAETRKGVLYVADTMNHRVAAFHMANGTLLWSREAYFPNDLRLLSSGRILIAEEHANRITEIDDQNRGYRVLFSCPDSLYRNPESTVQEIMREEPSKSKAAKSGKTIGVAAEEHSGPATLYSPNGVTPVSDDSYFVADTDNHRVVLVRQGKIASTLRGFNNPVKICLLKE